MRTAFFRPVPALILAAAAGTAQAFPLPDDIRGNGALADRIAAQSRDEFYHDQFDRFAFTMETLAGNARTHEEMTHSRRTMKVLMRNDNLFMDELTTYKGLIGAYAQILPIYEAAFKAFQADPSPANRTAWNNAKGAYDTISKAFEPCYESLQLHYRAVAATQKPAATEEKHKQ